MPAQSTFRKVLTSILLAFFLTAAPLSEAIGAGSLLPHANEIGVTLIDANPQDRSRASLDRADIMLPKCASDIEVYCLEDLYIYKDGATKEKADFFGDVLGHPTEANPALKLPAGADAHLFKASTNSGVVGNYSVKLVAHFIFDNRTKLYEHINFAIFVQSYEIEKNNSLTPASSFDVNRYAWAGIGESGRIIGFPKDVRAAVTVRLPSSEGGWFSGRVRDPLVNVETSGNLRKLTIDALAATVPRVQAWVPAEKKTPLMEKLQMTPGGGAGIESGFDDSVDWVDQLRPFVNDVSTSEETVWVVRSTFIRNPCFPDSRISGFVTTNAMAYSWNPPIFKNGFLDYKVAGMHTSSTGEITKGTYDLVLNSETARCLYKFTSAPISATVSIIGDSGDSRAVETTVVNEKDGYLKLSAYGFTFSSPVVRVKLVQETLSTSNKISAPITVPKKVTISCVKGKIVKKVSAINPKCPSGYRAK